MVRVILAGEFQRRHWRRTPSSNTPGLLFSVSFPNAVLPAVDVLASRGMSIERREPGLAKSQVSGSCFERLFFRGAAANRYGSLAAR